VAAIGGYVLIGRVQGRIDTWLNPWNDAAGSSYQIVQSLIALASGSGIGQGLGQGWPDVILPAAHTDMPLAAIGEEVGLIGTLGVVIERVAYRPLRHAPRLAPLISAIGVSIFLQNAVLLWVDSKAIPYPQVFPVSKVFEVGSASLNTLQLLIIVTSISLLVVLDTFVSRTRVGKAMRATSQDREAAGLMGIDINYVIALAFFIGPALGAVAGIFNGMYYGTVIFSMGFIPGIKSFTAAVLGGIGNLRGAMLGGFLLGIVESLGAGFLSTGYKDVIAFGILILVLIFRPGGLLGESVVEKV
jgi:branched-chain amino acid transport system permease protein